MMEPDAFPPASKPIMPDLKSDFSLLSPLNPTYWLNNNAGDNACPNGIIEITFKNDTGT